MTDRYYCTYWLDDATILYFGTSLMGPTDRLQGVRKK